MHFFFSQIYLIETIYFLNQFFIALAFFKRYSYVLFFFFLYTYITIICSSLSVSRTGNQCGHPQRSFDFAFIERFGLPRFFDYPRLGSSSLPLLSLYYYNFFFLLFIVYIRIFFPARVMEYKHLKFRRSSATHGTEKKHYYTRRNHLGTKAALRQHHDVL